MHDSIFPTCNITTRPGTLTCSTISSDLLVLFTWCSNTKIDCSIEPQTSSHLSHGLLFSKSDLQSKSQIETSSCALLNVVTSLPLYCRTCTFSHDQSKNINHTFYGAFIIWTSLSVQLVSSYWNAWNKVLDISFNKKPEVPTWSNIS